MRTGSFLATDIMIGYRGAVTASFFADLPSTQVDFIADFVNKLCGSAAQRAAFVETLRRQTGLGADTMQDPFAPHEGTRLSEQWNSEALLLDLSLLAGRKVDAHDLLKPTRKELCRKACQDAMARFMSAVMGATYWFGDPSRSQRLNVAILLEELTEVVGPLSSCASDVAGAFRVWLRQDVPLTLADRTTDEGYRSWLEECVAHWTSPQSEDT